MPELKRWNEMQQLKRKLTGRSLQYWSRREPQGSDKSFTVEEIRPNQVSISGKTLKPRVISRSDFEYVEGLWPDYRDRKLRRDQLNRSQNTTYILTLLNWIDSQ